MSHRADCYKLSAPSFTQQRDFNLAILNVGAPAAGMNAAVRSFVRSSLVDGYRVYGVHDGFEGLVNDKVRIRIFNAEKMKPFHLILVIVIVWIAFLGKINICIR